MMMMLCYAGYPSSSQMADQHLSTAYPIANIYYGLPMDTAMPVAVAGNASDGVFPQLMENLSSYNIGRYFMHTRYPLHFTTFEMCFWSGRRGTLTTLSMLKYCLSL